MTSYLLQTIIDASIPILLVMDSFLPRTDEEKERFVDMLSYQFKIAVVGISLFYFLYIFYIRGEKVDCDNIILMIVFRIITIVLIVGTFIAKYRTMT